MSNARSSRSTQRTTDAVEDQPTDTETRQCGGDLARVRMLLGELSGSHQCFSTTIATVCAALSDFGFDIAAWFARPDDLDDAGLIAAPGVPREDLQAVGATLRTLFSTEQPITDAPFTAHVPGLGACWLVLRHVGAEGEDEGWLVLLARGEGGFDATTLAALDYLVLPVQLLIRQIEAEDENRLRELERSTIARITQAVVAMTGPESVFEEVAAAVLALTGWDSCAVAMHVPEADHLLVQAIETHSETLTVGVIRDEKLRLSDWQSLRFALDNCSPYRLSLNQQQALLPAEAEYLRDHRINLMVAIPFAAKSEALGLLLLSSATLRRIEPRVLKTLDEICLNTALAVQHHRYLEQARLQAVEQTALIRVSQAVISGRDLNSILAEIARVCLGFEGVEGCRILLWQKERDQFEIAAVQHTRDWQMYYRTGDRYPAGDWPSLKAVMMTRTARGLLVSDSEVNARERYNHAADHIQSFHSFPIIVGDAAVGVLTMLSRQHRRMSQAAAQIGHELAAQAAHAIDRADLFGQLQRRAETDGLTGLLNHRAAFEMLDRELAAARKLNDSLSIIVVDLDDFKFFNDTHGHLTGDRVLVEVAAALREIARARDYVARYGGDEFLIILPGSNREAVAALAERLLRRMDSAIVTVGDMTLPIRISMGIATYPNHASNRQELIAYADAAMYSAKELGGGQLGAVEKGTRSLEVTALGALSGLVRAVDRKDRYTKDHSDLVAEYAVRFGRFIGLPSDQIEALEVAGQLHDVGKIAVPDSVLRKPGRLDPEEEALIRQHVVFSELIIKGIPHLEFIQEAVAHHHERWDGKGYPYAKAGEQIPLMGRILALSDSLAAMTHDRPYRKARTLEEAVVEIRRGSGTQFDPDLVEDFVAAVSTGTAMLREVNRRRRFNPHNVDPDEPPVVVGLTDYLRIRLEKMEAHSDELDTA